MANSNMINKPNNFFEKHTLYIYGVVIAILSFIIYSNSFQSSFHFDDIYYIINNDFIKELDHFNNLEYWFRVNQRPLPTWSFALNYNLHGLSVSGYHIVNLLLHLITGIVVFLLSKQILSFVYKETSDRKKYQIISLFIALVFISHPVQTQTVNYIVQRMTLFAGLFYFLSVYYYLKARVSQLSNKKSQSIAYYALTLISMYFALISKQNTATIPLIFLLLEILFIRDSSGKVNKPYIIIGSSLLILSGLIVIFGGYLPSENDFISREAYFATQLKVIFLYIKTLIYPFSLNLDPAITISEPVFLFKELLLLVAHVLILILGIVSYRKNKLITLGIFWFYITLLVESSIIPIRDVAFDHRLYVPVFGFILIFVTLLVDLISKKRSFSYAMTVLVVISFVYSVSSFQRNKVWKNEYSLWADVVSKPPVKARSYGYLGNAYMDENQYGKALETFSKSIEIEPERWQEYHNRASVYKLLKRYQSSINELNTCIKLKPEYDKFFIDRADCFLKLKKYSLAISDLQKAIGLNDKNKKAYSIMGVCLLNQNKNVESISYSTKALEIDPLYVEALNNRGVACMRLERFEESVQDFSKVISLDSKFQLAYHNRGDCYYYDGRYNEAISDYSYYILLNKKSSTAYYGRGSSYLKLGKYKSALSDLKKAKSLGKKVNENLLKELESV